jgi:putative ATP-binding cassette transporter
VVSAWRDVCLQSMRTTVVSQTSGYTAPILPIILCAPKFLDGALTLGEVMQAASAFVLVQSALNWMVDNYPRLAEWVASARREAIEDQLGGLDQYSASPRKGVMYVCDNEVGRAAQMRLSLRQEL